MAFVVDISAPMKVGVLVGVLPRASVNTDTTFFFILKDQSDWCQKSFIIVCGTPLYNDPASIQSLVQAGQVSEAHAMDTSW